MISTFSPESKPTRTLKVTFAPNLAKKISTNFYYLSLLFQLSVAYSENFKEIKAWEVLKFWKENRNLTNLFRLAEKADRVYVMPSLYFVRKFYNLRTYAARPCRRVFTAFFKFEVPFLQKFGQIHGGSEAPVFKIQDFNDLYLCQ